MKRSTASLLALALAGFTLAADATAQTNVVSLPGDATGTKLPFQVSAGVYMSNSCTFVLNFSLPAGDVTIEMVTANITVREGHAPTLFLAPVVSGQAVEHKIALDLQTSIKDSATNITQHYYQATHLVRLHHHSEVDVPLSGGIALSYTASSGGCPFAMGGVSLAGYYRPAP